MNRTSFPAADLLLVNASVHTMDPERPTAQAVAISGNRIVSVGTTAQVRSLAGPGTRVIDAEHQLVLPGFNDAHVHFLMGGFSLSNVDLREARSLDEVALLLGNHAARLPDNRWILGGDWDHELWPGAPLPTRWDIDRTTPHHPVLVNRLDGHMALANSLALQLAGITRHTVDVPGGLIVRDQKTGEPTGLLKDAAISLVERVVPARTFEEKRHAALAATDHAARCGVTSVTDVSGGEDVGLYQHMLERGELKTRIYAAHSIVSVEVLTRTGVRAGFGNDMLRIGALKGFADGSLGSSTALFFEPYTDDPANRGLLFDQMLPEGVMLDRVLQGDKQALQVMVHAIGDEANQLILDIYQRVAEQNGPRDRRLRIEHAQHLRTPELGGFGRQKVIASMQPYHAADDGRWCEKRIGNQRAQGTYAFRALLDAGAVLAFGSDWTVAPLNPLVGL
ncbi:MAG TPA: amidohydrolase, partial [Verrucomicrobiae bacterium]|nr:amidohydrolase [Verrucomicrobiae bacterium]